MRGAVRAGVLALAVVASPLPAQQVSLRLGGVHTEYADAVSGSAGLLTTRVVLGTPGLRATLGGSFARFTTGPWAAQASANLVGIRFPRRNLGVGLRLGADGGYLRGGIWSGTALATPVVALVAGNWVFSGAVTSGAVRRVDRMALLLLGAAAQVRRDLGPWTLEGDVRSDHAGPYHYADGSVDLEFRGGPLTLGAEAGARTGNLGGHPWYQASATLRITRWATLEAAGGSYPRDVSGFIGGSFISVGVRVALRRPDRTSTAVRIARRLASSRSSVTVEATAPGHQQVIFHLPGARTVAIAGEWNEWTPVALLRLDDDRWRADLSLSQGAHRFSLVVNGRRWVVPPGVATLPDDMGGQVGLLVIDQ